LFIDTGQHYDYSMAGSFFRELGLAAPQRSLDIGSGSHASQTGRMLAALEPILVEEAPDAVLVYGDTNSTLAAALTAAKLGIPVAHVEAGLRSFDRRMPEEINRVVVDHLSDRCFAPTPTAVANLAREGIETGVALVGDLMQDLAARIAPTVRDPAILGPIGDELDRQAGLAAPLRPGGYLLATIHRAENREPAAVEMWTGLLEGVSRPDRPVILALHPGTALAVTALSFDFPDSVRVVPPLPYRTTLALQLHAAAVLTDSGGIQREAAWLGTPCLVLRDTTEWVEAVASSAGRMIVVGLDRARAVAALADVAGPDAAARAAVRAAQLRLPPSGAAEAISRELDMSGVIR
jgi:UDP-N-acetylglucosamine 2-epimerase